MEFRKTVTITPYVRQQKRHRCTEQSFGLCGRRRGCDVSKEQHVYLSIVKQITSPGGMHETSARAWCTGKTQRGRWEGGSGWGIHVTPWLIHVNVWQNPLKCCEVISLQLIKINEKKKKKKMEKHKCISLFLKGFFFFSFCCGPFLKPLLNLLKYCFYFMFFALWLWSMWDLSPQTRDWKAHKWKENWKVPLHWKAKS